MRAECNAMRNIKLSVAALPGILRWSSFAEFEILLIVSRPWLPELLKCGYSFFLCCCVHSISYPASGLCVRVASTLIGREGVRSAATRGIKYGWRNRFA